MVAVTVRRCKVLLTPRDFPAPPWEDRRNVTDENKNSRLSHRVRSSQSIHEFFDGHPRVADERPQQPRLQFRVVWHGERQTSVGRMPQSQMAAALPHDLVAD